MSATPSSAVSAPPASTAAGGDALDCTDALQPCNCTANEICVQIGRSGTTCARNTCIPRSGASSGEGKASVGALAGQAVGGVIGGLVIIVAIYWFWWRRRGQRGGASRPRRTQPNNPLKEFRIGKGNRDTDEKDHHDVDAEAADGDVTAPAGPGEEDAQPVKRQSLRFDPNNSGSGHLQKRSLSGNQLSSSGPAPPTASRGGDNPFADHNSHDGTPGHTIRDSAATISEFSFRSSQSTNIIPIAYIPAHAASNSIADLQEERAAYGQRSSRLPPVTSQHSRGPTTRHSLATATTMTPRTNGQLSESQARSSRLSVPFSLRSSNADDSMSAGTSSYFGGKGATFSAIFDKPPARMPEADAQSPTSTAGSNARLEVIASPTGTGSLSPSTRAPTLATAGYPLRPPRAPDLDLKLPEPESMSPPLGSPGYAWANSPISANSPTGTLHPSTAAHRGQSRNANRETLRTVPEHDASRRGSGYSTLSQTTTSSISHMSYILDPPQIITPVTANGVQIVNRATAKAIKLPQSGQTSVAVSPNPALMSMSPLGQMPARAGTASPMSDNPFDDDAAVRIAVTGPSTQNTPVVRGAGTFAGTAPLRELMYGDDRSTIRSAVSSRRGSDLSILTSSSMHHASPQDSLVVGNAIYGQPAHAAFNPLMSHSSFESYGPTRSISSDEIILTPPARPFAQSQDDLPASRHTSAAMSTRSGYASVLDGIPFNLSLSPEARHSNASLLADNGARASVASSSDGKRDTSYSLASEWNGAFAGMPAASGPADQPMPELPSMYLSKTAAQNAARDGPVRDDRYSTDSLAMAAEVARQFGGK